MSGHSKWHRIKRKKAVTDAKRGQEFTRLATQIRNAARTNPHPDQNLALADAITRARAANMPQVNIDRLLAQETAEREEIVYEAFGPAGISLLITCRTDNTNRTISEIRTILKKHGGNLGQPGSVIWKFIPRCLTSVAIANPNLPEGLELALIEAGADDLTTTGQTLTISSSPAALPAIKAAVAAYQLPLLSSVTSNRSRQRLPLDPASTDRLRNLLAELAAHPDITTIASDAALD